jgi:WD40 repeat protein
MFLRGGNMPERKARIILGIFSTAIFLTACGGNLPGQATQTLILATNTLRSSEKGPIPSFTSTLTSSFTPTPLALLGITQTITASNVENLREWGRLENVNSVECIQYSPDGSLIAAGLTNGALLIWNVAGKKVQTWIIPMDKREWNGSFYVPIKAIAFSPNGQLLASPSRRFINIWKVSDGILVNQMDAFAYSSGLAFSPDGRLLASGDSDGIRVWRMDTGGPMYSMDFNSPSGGYPRVAFSPDGNLLAIASHETPKIMKINDGSLRSMEDPHTGGAMSVSFSPDSKLLASASSDGKINIWNVSDGILTNSLDGHTDQAFSASFSPDGSILASGSKDNTVRLWSVADGALKLTLEGHEFAITSVAFSPDGKLLAFASIDGTINLWGITGSGVR